MPGRDSAVPTPPRDHGVRLGRPRAPWASLVACAITLALTLPAQADNEACLTAHEQGQDLRMRGRLRAAREQFVACAQTSCPRIISQDCATLLGELEQQLPSVVLAIRKPDGTPVEGARVLADGETIGQHNADRAVMLEPGEHTLRIEAEGFAPVEQKLTVEQAQQGRVVRIELPALETAASGSAQLPSADSRTMLDHRGESSSGKRRRLTIATYALGGSAVAVLGAGIALGVAGERERDRLDTLCGQVECNRSDTQKGRSQYIAADVAFGTAGLLAVAAAWVFVVRLVDAERALPMVSARLDRDGGRLSYQRSF